MLTGRQCRNAIALLVAVSAAGCTPEAQRYIRFPRLFSPGPAGLQRAEAIRHDPYPLPDVGPEVEGGRPREYQQPVPEVDRARMATIPPLVAQPLVPPAPWQPAPPIVTGPPVVSGPPPAAVPPAVSGPPVVTAPYPPAVAPVPHQVQPRSPY